MIHFFNQIPAIAIGVALEMQSRVCQIVVSLPQTDTLSLPNSETVSGWRRTSQGWEDSSRWFSESDAPPQLLELVHPLVWTMLVLIAVISVMIWASEEWELARLFGKEE